jgi:multiple sugar transport system permease protein
MKPSARRNEALSSWALIAPGLLLYAAFVIVPTIGAIYLSFTDYDLTQAPRFVGLANYANLVGNRELTQAIANTVVMFLEAGMLSIPIAFVLANVLNMKLRGFQVVGTMYLLPLVVSGAAIATIFRYVFYSRGLLNSLLSPIGPIDIGYLSDPTFAIHAVSFILMWTIVPLNVVFYLAALQGVPADLHDAATVDGAGAWARMRHLTWPLSTPTTFLLLILNVTAVAISSFDIVNILTKGQPQGTTVTVLYLVYKEAFLGFRLGAGSAIGVLLLVALLIFTILQFRLQRRWAHYQ